jgi:hypothetical protein
MMLQAYEAIIHSMTPSEQVNLLIDVKGKPEFQKVQEQKLSKSIN